MPDSITIPYDQRLTEADRQNPTGVGGLEKHLAAGAKIGMVLACPQHGVSVLILATPTATADGIDMDCLGHMFDAAYRSIMEAGQEKAGDY